MYSSHSSFFVDPYTSDKLTFLNLNSENDKIIEAVFVNQNTNTIYPVERGVPIFIKNRVSQEFYKSYKDKLQEILGSSFDILSQINKNPISFSFSYEWEAAHKDKVDSVWGIEIEERLKIHYQDTETSAENQKGKLVLDVGCGNGILCKALGEKGAIVFAADYSTSVWNAEERMSHPNVCFFQADLHYLPFNNEQFDIVYSNGVLHHTPNTENAFKQVAQKVKKGGKYYVWLYSRSKSISFNAFLYITDAMRFVVNKLPFFLQKEIVEGLLQLKIKYNELRKTQMEEVAVARTNLYDTLTPQYKYYHTITEAKGWYTKYGFINPRKTHENIYGFGILGDRKD